MRIPAVLAFFALLATLLAACSGSGKADPQPLEGINSGTYIALGDSLSAGVGASSPETTFVGLMHQDLGPQVELMNLGHSGDTSDDLLQGGMLDKAVNTIKERNGDDDKSNDVRLVTLEIGGNDLLHINSAYVQTGICPDVQTTLAKPECTNVLRETLDRFRSNFQTALDRLRDADADVPIAVMTLYNPFDYLGAIGELGVLSLDGQAGTDFPEGVNDIIRSVAADHEGVTVADVYSAFQGETASLISSDFIHPNDAGYRVMADAFIAALKQ